MKRYDSGPAVRQLERMTWPEVGAAVSGGLPILAPVGALEQHGHHMPLGTDGFLPHQLAIRVATQRSFVIAPPLFFAARPQPRSGGGGLSFPGTIGVRGDTLTSLFTDIASEYFRQGFRRLVVLNGHFENTPFLFAALETVIQPHGTKAKALLLNWWELVERPQLDHIFGGSFPGWEAEHAGIAETSLMEELMPELVRSELKTDASATRSCGYDIFPTPVDTIPTTGVPGRSTPASRAIGEYLATALVDRISAILDEEFGPPQVSDELVSGG